MAETSVTKKLEDLPSVAVFYSFTHQKLNQQIENHFRVIPLPSLRELRTLGRLIWADVFLLVFDKQVHRDNIKDSVRCIAQSNSSPILVVLDKFDYAFALDLIGEGASDCVAGTSLTDDELLYKVAALSTARKNIPIAKNEFAPLIENAPFGINFVSSEGRIMRTNPAFEKLTGYNTEELKRLRVEDITHPEDISLDIENFKEIMAGNANNYTIAKRYIRKDGTIVWVNLTVFVERGEQGEIKAGFAIVEDITARKKMEERVALGEKFEALGRVAGNIAHDFHNYIFAMQCNLSFMEGEIALEHPVREYISNLTNILEKSTRLTSQLLAFGKKNKMALDVIQLNQVILNMDKVLKSMLGNIVLDIKLDEQLLPVMADYAKIEQVIINLTLNAKDSIRKNGSILISTSNVSSADELKTGSVFGSGKEHPEGCFVRLSIKDTGTGIAPDVLQKIFEPFFTTKEPDKGTGLGLATVYGIIQQCEGYIKVESIEGEGSTFSIYLPCITD